MGQLRPNPAEVVLVFLAECFEEGTNAHGLAGCAVWPADAREKSELHGDCGLDAGPGHRREHGDLFAFEPSAAEEAAGPQSGRIGDAEVARAKTRACVERRRRLRDLLLPALYGPGKERVGFRWCARAIPICG